MAVAHLYNALKQCGYLPDDCEWEDMNLLIQIHGRQDIFLGNFPKTMEDCTKRLALFQGVSPQTFARNRRKGGSRVIFSKSGGRLLKQASPIASIFRDRFLSDGDVDLSVTAVEVLLGRRSAERKKKIAKLKEFLQTRMHKTEEGKTTNKIDLGFDKVEWPARVQDESGGNAQELPHPQPTTQQSTVDESPEADVGQQTAPVQNPNSKSFATDSTGAPQNNEEEQDQAQDAPLIPINHSRPHLTLSTFLTNLASALTTEHPALALDYFSLFRRLWLLLESIQTATLSTLPLLDPDTVTPETLPSILLLLASNPQNAPNILGLGLRDSDSATSTDSTPLKIAAAVMKNFIESGQGSIEAKRYADVEEPATTELDAATRKALDEIESIRDVTGALPIEDGEDSEAEEEERVEELAEMARRMLDGARRRDEECAGRD